MKKLNFLLLAISVSLLSTNSFGAPKVYGKINIAADDGNGTDDYVNNASRLGVKGTMDLKNGLTGIYQVEYEITLPMAKRKMNKQLHWELVRLLLQNLP